jgi:hypothetical protein
MASNHCATLAALTLRHKMDAQNDTGCGYSTIQVSVIGIVAMLFPWHCHVTAMLLPLSLLLGSRARPWGYFGNSTQLIYRTASGSRLRDYPRRSPKAIAQAVICRQTKYMRIVMILPCYCHAMAKLLPLLSNGNNMAKAWQCRGMLLRCVTM